jgi:DNA replication protein DnaC
MELSNLSFSIDGHRELPKYREVIVDGDSVLVETEEWKTYKRLALVDKRLNDAGIKLSPSFSFDTYTGDDKNNNISHLKQYVDQFESKFKTKHLYFYSKENSTQKTTLAKLTAKGVCSQGFSVRFILMGDLTKKLTQETFEEDSDLEEYRSVDLLIVDDAFDTRKTTVYRSGYQLSHLDIFLRDRLETKQKATIFTSNSDYPELDTGFGPHISALIKRNCIRMHFTDSINQFDLTSIWD